MRFHSVDYRKDRGESPRALVHRGFWWNDLPRLILGCRLLGHAPVVDGYDPPPSFTTGRPSRWVTCDRCGVRPEPQGSLDPERWSVGDTYDGPCRSNEHDRSLPGSWPAHPVGVLGGELVIGRSFGGVSVQAKVGNAGSDHTLAAHVRVGMLGALYLHTESFGTWLQRRLNPVGYHSRVIGMSVEDGRFRWELWAKRDESSSDDQGWMRGSVRVDPRDIVLGEARYSYTDVGDRVPAVVRMPHGDDHVVTLQLQRQTFGRARGPKRETWAVDWECKGGIPAKPGGRGRVSGSGVKVFDPGEADMWVEEATAAIAHALAGDRARYGHRPDHAAV